LHWYNGFLGLASSDHSDFALLSVLDCLIVINFYIAEVNFVNIFSFHMFGFCNNLVQIIFETHLLGGACFRVSFDLFVAPYYFNCHLSVYIDICIFREESWQGRLSASGWPVPAVLPAWLPWAWRYPGGCHSSGVFSGWRQSQAVVPLLGRSAWRGGIHPCCR